MANDALRALEDLDRMGQQGQAAAANSQKLMEERSRPETVSDGQQAKFALPEALATAVGAGWVLGPVGGILMGVAQGILIKNEKQQALNAYLADTDALNNTKSIIDNEFDQADLEALTDADRQQISGFRTMSDMGMAMSKSPYPDTAQRGAAMITESANLLDQFRATNESQMIAAKAADDQLRRDLDNETYTRHRGLLGDFGGRIGDFDQSIATADNIIEAVNKGDGASLTAALATLPLLVNPSAGATTEGEVEIWQKISGTVDGLLGRVQKELGGGGMTDSTRKQLLGVANQFKRNTISAAQAVEAEFGEHLVNEKIPRHLWGQYNRTGRLQVVQEGGFVRGDDVSEASSSAGADIKKATTGLIDKASMAIGDTIDAVKHEKAWRDEFFRIHNRQPRMDER